MTFSASSKLPTLSTPPRGLSREEVREVILSLAPHLEPDTRFAFGPDEVDDGLIVQIIDPCGPAVMGSVSRINGSIAVMDFEDQLDPKGASGPYETIPEAVAALRLAWGVTQNALSH